jgi:hypothetical protein
MTSLSLRRFVLPLLQAAVLTISTASFADTWAPRPPGDRTPTQAEIDEASKRYNKGINLYEVESDYAGALIELQRAYDLAPNYQVLFNIGQAGRMAKDYVTSQRAFEAYLKYGGTNVPEDKRAVANKELAALKDLVGTVKITTNATSGMLLIDDVEIAQLPITDPIPVNLGSHRIVIVSGAERVSKTITAAGGDQVTVDLQINVEIKKDVPIPVVKKPEPEPSYAWIGWLVSSALGAGAIISGTVAIVEKNNLDDRTYVGATPPEDLVDKRSTVDTLGIVTDVLIGCAVAGAGISLYFTIRDATRDDDSTSAPATTAIRVAPDGLTLIGSF